MDDFENVYDFLDLDPDDLTVYCKKCGQAQYAGELNLDGLCSECEQ